MSRSRRGCRSPERSSGRQADNAGTSSTILRSDLAGATLDVRNTVSSGGSNVGVRSASTHALATAQKATTVWVKAAVPVSGTGQLKVYLNAAAPSGGVAVAWWLLEA